MKMKRTMLTVRDLIIMVVLYVLPLVIGMEVNTALKGDFDFTFRYLTMVLFGAGGVLALMVFRKWGAVEIPKEGKAPAGLSVWYILFGAMSALVPIMFLLHNAADEELHCDLVKQTDAVLFAPFAEEILCRCLMTHIIKRGSETKTVCIITAVLTSALWTIPHCYAPMTAARVFITGIIASMIYQKTGSLKLCILEHAANNLCVTIVLLIGRTYTSPLPLVMTVIAALIIAAGFVRETAKLFRTGKNVDKTEIRAFPAMQ